MKRSHLSFLWNRRRRRWIDRVDEKFLSSSSANTDNNMVAVAVSRVMKRSSAVITGARRTETFHYDVTDRGTQQHHHHHHHHPRFWTLLLPMRHFSGDGKDSILSSNKPDDHTVKTSWNDRANSFLKSLSSQETSPLQQDADRSTMPCDKVAQEIEDLLTDLMQRTAIKFQKDSSVSTDTTDTTLDPHHDEYEFSWDFFRLHEQSPVNESTTTTTELIPETEQIDIQLVFSLLDLLVMMEKSEGMSFTKHISDWTTLSSCLNPILQFWKHEYSNSLRSSSSFTTKSRSIPPSCIPPPSQLLVKLDQFRQDSNFLLPDVRSYNILLDAVATKPLNRRHGPSGIDISFCQKLWSWMWQEAKRDSLVRPDIVTIRTMFKAHVATRHELAPQRCEQLMGEWIRNQQSTTDDGANNNDELPLNQSYNQQQQIANVLLSLVHVWATYNPQVAEAYLKQLADSFVSGTIHVPPDTIAWNRVISAYAITHSQPDQGHRVLEDFWKFYQHVHEPAADESISEANQYSFASSSNAWKVGPPNLSSYNAVLEGYALQGNASEAQKMYDRLEMASSTSPSIETYTSLIKAYGKDLETINMLAEQYISKWKEQNRQRSRIPENEATNSHTMTQAELRIDLPFFHAWLKACAKAGDIPAAKKVLMSLKSCDLNPTSTTYLAFLEVFLARREPQAAIEWLLAYAKLERLTENDIVTWTIRVLDWYEQERNGGENIPHNVDSMVFLQVLCENGFITSDEAVEWLLSNVTAEQALSILEWIPGSNQPTLKSRAIVMRKLAKDPSKSELVERMFMEWGHLLQDQEYPDLSLRDAKKQEIIGDMCTSLISVWASRNNMRKVMSWLQIIEASPILPPLSRIAQMNIVQAYCRMREPMRAEEFVLGMERSRDVNGVGELPDLIMKNVVLKAWANEGNGSRAALFLQNHIKDADITSQIAVINAYCLGGEMDQAEKFANELVKSYVEDPVESTRPERGMFAVLLAGWRRSQYPNAADRAEKLLLRMDELFHNGILLEKPNYKSYEVVLDTWEKSSHPDAGARALKLVSSSPFPRDKKLMERVRRIQSKCRRNNSGRQNHSLVTA
ncbi:PPR: pentatricopeptide repeat domain containing protein [Nitzschia inconspicua]|uniref:PPR: pentatricopeptide repeat domain containing protein n=1 Tax=Nitzschia inconspicua TaxID=303405 RepID=A0A9K3KQP6_9STRA|nr:PPR: pentatricopeptide repeat domain containing protein [Nitzschia inconspicua]